MSEFRPLTQSVSYVTHLPESWKHLGQSQRLIGQWIVLTLLVGALYFTTTLLHIIEPFMFNYFLGLYTINSLFFFFIVRSSLLVAKSLVLFLLILELVVICSTLLTFLATRV